jgi:hypothetical protein
MNFILFKSNEIISIYNNIDEILNFIYHIIDALIFSDIKKINYVNDFTIIEYNNSIQINKYIFDINRLTFVNDNDIIYNSSNKKLLEKYNYIKIKINNCQNQDNDLKICLNLDTEFFKNNVGNRKETTYEWLIKEDTGEKLSSLNSSEKIKKLNEIKEKFDEETKNIEILKTKCELIEKKYFYEKKNVYSYKLKLKRHHERMEELKRKFYVDKNLYFIIKEEILQKKRDETAIPELFIDTYNIFLNLDINNKLNFSTEVNDYIDELKKIPDENNYDDFDFDMNDKYYNKSDNESDSYSNDD